MTTRAHILRAARDDAGLNQLEIGRVIGPYYGRDVSDTEVSRWERGARRITERELTAYYEARLLNNDQWQHALLLKETA